VLTGIAAIALSDDVIRRSVTDELKLLPLVSSSLSYTHVGVRHAACQCVRVLSRAVAVLRTNIMDTGLGLLIFDICRKEDEDRRVTSAALAAVCNLVNDCSPLRPVRMMRSY
jgi:armadillo repeat-containing protein 8